MKTYLKNYIARKTIQFIMTGIQIVFMVIAIIFMYLFVSSGTGKETPNYAVIAIVFTIIWCAYYLVQLIFASATYNKTVTRSKLDLAFLIVSVTLLPFGCAIYGILIALM